MATVHKQRSRLHTVADQAAVAAPVERKYATHDRAYKAPSEERSAEGTGECPTVVTRVFSALG